MKIYHMVIENIQTKKRKLFFNRSQGSAPQGWRCISVCGYHEEHTSREGKACRK